MANRRILLGVLMLLVTTPTGQARSVADDQQEHVEQRRVTLESLGETLENNSFDRLQAREQLRQLREVGRSELEPLQLRQTELEDDIKRLGVAPGDDEPPEITAVQTERHRLTVELSRIDGLIRQIDLNITEATRLLGAIADAQREDFYSQLLTRAASPFDPAVALAALSSFRAGWKRIALTLRTWFVERQASGTLLGPMVVLIGAVLLGLFLFIPVRRWIDEQLRRRLASREPTPAWRMGAAIGQMAARAFPAILAGAVVYGTLLAQEFIGEAGQSLARWLWVGFVTIIAVDGLATAVYAPLAPAWRLISLRSAAGHTIRFLLVTLAIVLVADTAMTMAGVILGVGQELALVQSSVVSVVVAAGLLMLSLPRLWRSADTQIETHADGSMWRQLRVGVRLLALFIVIAVMFSYVALGYYLAVRACLIGGVVAAAWFARAVFHEGIRTGARYLQRDPASKAVRESLPVFWLSAVANLLLLLVVAPIVLLILGVEWRSIVDALGDAFFGFQVGSVTISIAEIFTAASIFLLVLTVTRMLQRTAEKRFFPRTRIDVGVSHSLTTLLGYAGLATAVVMAMQVLGVNLSNLALIAGALSVGIGFGLQSIVNNFVSGLILLFERPIKVGDWIVVSSGEGFVKRISVRSTEIETFDRASVIVPNSELISGTVTNWTHKDKIGRVIVPVGVSYDEDPEHVQKTLEDIGAAYDKSLTDPAPMGYFAGFGDSSLDFELRVFIRDVEDSIRVRNDLRIVIFKTFREIGIQIPFPQRDVHLRAVTEKTSLTSVQQVASTND